jgi:hypothetical protein
MAGRARTGTELDLGAGEPGKGRTVVLQKQPFRGLRMLTVRDRSS